MPDAAPRERVPRGRPLLVLYGGLGAAALLSLITRADGFAPYSLWLDDLWVAVLVKSAGVAELFELAAPAPVGFLLMLKAITALAGDGAWQLQILPLACSLVQVPLVGHLCYRLTGRLSLGFVCGLLLVAARTLAVLSLRVKPFALDGVVTAILLLLALRTIRSKSVEKYCWFCAVSACASFFSFASVFISVLWCNLIALDRLLLGRRSEDSNERLAYFFVWAAFHGVSLLGYLVVLRPQSTASIVAYWTGYYAPLDDPSTFVAFLANRGATLFSGALPYGFAWLAWLTIPGIVWLFSRRECTSAAFVLLFYVQIVVASALHLYPMGGGRTDVFSYPVTLLGVGAGLWCVSHFAPRGTGGVLLLVTLALVISTFPHLRVGYPPVGDRFVVERMNEIVDSEAGVIIYPWANWAVGYYGRWPIELVPMLDSTNHFYVHPQRARTLQLHETLDGREFLEDPGVLIRQMEPFVDMRYRRIVYIGTSIRRNADQAVVTFLRSRGYVARMTERRGGAVIIDFLRRESLHGQQGPLRRDDDAALRRGGAPDAGREGVAAGPSPSGQLFPAMSIGRLLSLYMGEPSEG